MLHVQKAHTGLVWLIGIGCLVSGLIIGGAEVSFASEADQGGAGVRDVSGVGVRDASVGGGGFRGFVSPSKQVIMTAPMDGVLQKVRVKEGDRVAIGAVLMEMDDGLQKVAVEAARMEAQSESEVIKNKLILEEAQIMLEQIEQAYKSNAANEWEVRRNRLQRDQAQAGYETAQQQHMLAQVKLKLEEERLARYRLKAPFDGVVNRVIVEQGASLTQKDEVLSIVAMETLEATVQVPADKQGLLKVKQKYSLQAGEPVNAVLSGKLKTVDPVMDAASQTIRCVFTIDNPDHKLPAGFIVILELPGK